MKPTKTITSESMEEADILFYIPTTVFGKLVGLFNGIKEGKLGIR